MSENIGMNVIIEFGATFSGVILALLAEHWYSNRQLQNRLNEILPYIYMELNENLWNLQQQHRDSHFITDYWETYRDDLRKWKEKMILQRIIRIYNIFDYEPPIEMMERFKRRTYATLLVEIIKWFDEKADLEPDFKALLIERGKHYSEMRANMKTGDPWHFRSKYYKL